MPKKINPDTTPGMKLLCLYSLLLFTGRKYFLGELAEKLECSKQTILRLVEQLEVSGLANIQTDKDVKRRWFKLEAPTQRPFASLDIKDIQNLLLCRDMVNNLLPDSMKSEIDRAIGHTTALLTDQKQKPLAWGPRACSQGKGTIDYSGQRQVIDTIRDSMTHKKVCRLIYASGAHPEGRSFCIAPVRLLAYRDAIYISAWRVPDKGPADKEYETNLALHRIIEVELTDREFIPDEKDQFQKKSTFGFMDGEPFEVKVEFAPSAARYVEERTWSEDQVLKKKRDGGVILTFSTTSELEVISWVLSFRATARVLEPEWLVKMVKKEIESVSSKYTKRRDDDTESNMFGILFGGPNV